MTEVQKNDIRPGMVVTIHNRQLNTVLDHTHVGKDNICQWAPHGGKNQMWKIEAADGQDLFTVKNVQYGDYLQSPGIKGKICAGSQPYTWRLCAGFYGMAVQFEHANQKRQRIKTNFSNTTHGDVVYSWPSGDSTGSGSDWVLKSGEPERAVENESGEATARNVAEIAELKAKLTVMETEATGARKAIDATQDERNKTLDENMTLKSKLSQAEARLAEAEKKAADAESRTTEADKRAAAAEQRAADAESKLKKGQASAPAEPPEDRDKQLQEREDRLSSWEIELTEREERLKALEDGSESMDNNAHGGAEEPHGLHTMHTIPTSEGGKGGTRDVYPHGPEWAAGGDRLFCWSAHPSHEFSFLPRLR